MTSPAHSVSTQPGTILEAALDRLGEATSRQAAAFERLGRESTTLDAARERLSRSLESSAARLAAVANKLRQAFGDEPAEIRPIAVDDRYDIN